MTVQTVAPQFKADQKLIAYIETKLGKLSTVFDVATENQRSFEAAVDLLTDKMRRQLKRYKQRQSKGSRRA